MIRKNFTNSITLMSILLILCMFVNIASTIYTQNKKLESGSSQIVSAFDG